MAILFNGINQGLNTGVTSLAQNVTQCTVMAWINVVSFPTVSGGIIQINVNASTTASRINLLLLSNGALRIGGRTDNTSYAISSVDSTEVLALNTWYHVTGMIDYANAIGYIYINGVQSAITGTLSFPAQITDNTTSSASNLGSDEFNSSEWCNIIIEDAQVYHRILSYAEIQTIYACRGTDTIVEDLQTRWLLVGPVNKAMGDVSTISVTNPKNAIATSNGSTLTLSSYTVPTGNNLVLVVAATAEGTNSGRVLATNVTFNGNALTNITSVTTSAYCGVSLWSISVTSGSSGNIVVTWSGNNSRRTVLAYTLVNAQNIVEASATSFNNTGVTTTGLTTISDNALIVTACANQDGYVMTAVGSNHSVDSTVVASTHAGAIGHVNTTIAGVVSGIGFTANPVPSGEALILAAFSPVIIVEQITELSDNEYVATALNAPVYTTSNLKFR